MTVFVTGGAGFIGSHFCRLLMKRDNLRVVCIDKLTYAGNVDNIADLTDKERFRFVKADIADREAMEKVFAEEKPQLVVNLAAESHVDRSISDPGIFLHSNVAGTEVLMSCCLKHGVKRFHQASTDEVYGDMPLDCCVGFAEDAPLRPSSPYAASKAAADLLALAFCRTYGLHVTVSRSSNNFGPAQYPEKLIPLTVKCAAMGEKVPVYGKGENVRDWIFVEDNCRAIELVAFGGSSGRIYNIGGGNVLSNIELVKKILALCGRDKEGFVYVADRKGHDRKYLLDCGRMEKELGFKPAARFEQALALTVKWYLEGGRFAALRSE